MLQQRWSTSIQPAAPSAKSALRGHSNHFARIGTVGQNLTGVEHEDESSPTPICIYI